MSQHDFVIDNASGLTVRTDINNALAAIVSNNSGASEPTTTFAYQWWVDTTTGLLKMRNAANSAWVTLGPVASYAFGLGAPYSGNSAPSSPYAYQWWVDTSGSPKLLKIRNAANSAWVQIGTNVEAANFGLLALTGGTMSAAIGFTNTDYTNVPVGTTAQRPGSPTEGMVRGNSDLDALEYYNGSAWIQGSGGGGMSITWETDANAPLSSIINNMRVHQFMAGEAQALWTTIKVPSSYVAGQQINLRSVFYSGDSSGNVYFKTLTTLIRTGTDAITSTTNQRTSSQGALTLGAGTVNKPQAITCDLSSSTGTINAVAVAAGDVLLIKLYRDASDTATGDAYFFPNMSEVK